MSALIDELRSSLRRSGVDTADRLIVGISGGVDSLVLAHALNTLRIHSEAPELTLVHVDHQLRPGSADDARSVERIASAFKLPLVVKRVDVAGWNERLHQGVEAAARAARYAALADVAREIGTEWVAVGHHLDDQVETVLYRLARGTSPDGLVGMREVSRRAVPLEPTSTDVHVIQLFRPLLNVRRSQIEAYAADHRLVAVEDESNSDTRFRRNGIRHEVIPILEQIFPGASVSIARNVDLLAGDLDLLSRLADESFRACCQVRGRCIELDRQQFRAQESAIQRRIVAHALHGLSPEHEVTRERIEALCSAALSGAVSNTIETGAGVAGWIDYDVVMLGPHDEIEPELRLRLGLPELNSERVIAVDGAITVQVGPRWKIALTAPDRLNGWAIRTRRSGDHLRLADGRRQRLQDWMVNRKVPSYVRDRLPLLVEDGVIRWVVGISASTFEDVNSGVVARLVESPEDDRLDGEQPSKK